MLLKTTSTPTVVSEVRSLMNSSRVSSCSVSGDVANDSTATKSAHDEELPNQARDQQSLVELWLKSCISQRDEKGSSRKQHSNKTRVRKSITGGAPIGSDKAHGTDAVNDDEHADLTSELSTNPIRGKLSHLTLLLPICLDVIVDCSSVQLKQQAIKVIK